VTKLHAAPAPGAYAKAVADAAPRPAHAGAAPMPGARRTGLPVAALAAGPRRGTVAPPAATPPRARCAPSGSRATGRPPGCPRRGGMRRPRGLRHAHAPDGRGRGGDEPGDAPGLDVRTRAERGATGQAAALIAAALAQQPAGLAVMASHGRGGVLRWALGSTAEDVLDQAPCPVLIVRARSGDTRAPAAPRAG
jgi:hypothetical protein